MSHTDQPSAKPATMPSGLAALNAAAVVAAALYFGQALLVPMVLAVLLAFVLAPAVRVLRRLRLGAPVAVLVTVALAFAVIGGIGLVVGTQAANLASELPKYASTIQQKAASLSVGSAAVDRLTASARRVLGAPGGEPGVAVVPAAPAPPAGFEAPSTLVIVRTLAASLLGPLGTAGIVIVFVIFVLLYREDLRDRLVRLAGRQDLHRTILALNEAAKRLSRFFLFQLALNTGFGVYVALALWTAGLPNPLLWGIVAAIMRFVPFIGSVIAVVPPMLLALAVSPGWSLALVVVALVIGGDLVMGQVVEPLIYGHSTGLSPIAVILAAGFWALLWGPIGLLIATPLTVCLVVVGRHVQALSFMDVMFGDASPLEPAETFYQRALENNRADLVAQARRQVAATSLAEYFDRVALRGLALAQSDLTREALTYERIEPIHAQVTAVLQATAATRPPPGTALPLPDWQADGAVACIPGRGQFDDLAATMAVQVMASRGFGARMLPNAALGSGGAEAAGFGAIRLCCLSVLEGGSSPASVRYFVRRIARHMPQAAIVVCLWQASRDSATLAALRSEGQEESIVLSLGELMALTQVLASRRGRSAEAVSVAARPA